MFNNRENLGKLCPIELFSYFLCSGKRGIDYLQQNEKVVLLALRASNFNIVVVIAAKLLQKQDSENNRGYMSYGSAILV